MLFKRPNGVMLQRCPQLPDRSIDDDAENNVATTTTPKGAKNGAKTIQNDPKKIQTDLKIARKRAENYTFSDGRIASDWFEIFGLIWNLIL